MRLFKSVENEKNNKKLAIAVLLGTLILSLGGVFIVRSKGHEEDLLNNIHINDVKVIYEDGLSTYYGTLTVDEKENIDTIKINVYQDDNKLATLYGYIGREVNPDDRISIEANTNVDLSNYNKIEYER